MMQVTLASAVGMLPAVKQIKLMAKQTPAIRFGTDEPDGFKETDATLKKELDALKALLAMPQQPTGVKGFVAKTVKPLKHAVSIPTAVAGTVTFPFYAVYKATRTKGHEADYIFQAAFIGLIRPDMTFRSFWHSANQRIETRLENWALGKKPGEKTKAPFFESFYFNRDLDQQRDEASKQQLLVNNKIEKHLLAGDLSGGVQELREALEKNPDNHNLYGLTRGFLRGLYHLQQFVISGEFPKLWVAPLFSGIPHQFTRSLDNVPEALKKTLRESKIPFGELSLAAMNRYKDIASDVDNPSDYLFQLINWGHMQNLIASTDEAVAFWQTVLDEERRIIAKYEPDQLFKTHQEMIGLYEKAGRTQDALKQTNIAIKEAFGLIPKMAKDDYTGVFPSLKGLYHTKARLSPQWAKESGNPAVKAMRDAVQRHPESWGVQRHLAATLLAEGQPKEALAAYQASLGLIKKVFPLGLAGKAFKFLGDNHGNKANCATRETKEIIDTLQANKTVSRELAIGKRLVESGHKDYSLPQNTLPDLPPLPWRKS